MHGGFVMKYNLDKLRGMVSGEALSVFLIRKFVEMFSKHSPIKIQRENQQFL